MKALAALCELAAGAGEASPAVASSAMLPQNLEQARMAPAGATLAFSTCYALSSEMRNSTLTDTSLSGELPNQQQPWPQQVIAAAATSTLAALPDSFTTALPAAVEAILQAALQSQRALQPALAQNVSAPTTTQRLANFHFVQAQTAVAAHAAHAAHAVQLAQQRKSYGAAVVPSQGYNQLTADRVDAIPLALVAPHYERDHANYGKKYYKSHC